MKLTVMTVAIAAAIGAVSPGFAQEKLKAASPAAAPAGAVEVPGGLTAQSAIAPGQTVTGSAKIGTDGAAAKVGAAGLVAQPGGTTKVKSVKE